MTNDGQDAAVSGSMHIANLRHDLLTPVNHIIGYGEILQMDAEQAGDAALVSSLVAIIADGRLLHQGIKESVREETLLAGQEAMARARADLRTVIARVIGACEVVKSQVEPEGTMFQDVDRVEGAARTLLHGVEKKFALQSDAAQTLTREDMPTLVEPEILSDPEPEAGPALTATSSGRLLVVDDIAENREILERRLTRLGYTVEVAGDGVQALAQLRHKPFDLVLLDIVMPVMDGHEVLKTMKADALLCGIPVIMISALNELDHVVNCVKMGADDYLGKVFNPVLLQARIEGCLERRKAKLQARELGRYTLKYQIGRGGMGEVYLARHAMLRRPTAVKVLMPSVVSERTIASFEREVQLTSRLTHPNTIAVYDYGRTPEGRFYFAMEYLVGLDLKKMVAREGPLSEARTLHILKQVCLSLAEAHEHGLIHRDIKPANIMLCERGGIYDFVKVLDFGIAMEVSGEGNGTQRGQAGTPSHMSPEAIESPESVDGRSDLYSLGCVAFFLLTGQFVFGDLEQADMFHAHTQTRAPALSEKRQRKFSKDLEALIAKCLAKDPKDRPQSARDLYQQILRCRVSGGWSEADMERWWKEHHAALESERRTKIGTKIETHALEVNFAHRTDPFTTSGLEDAPTVEAS